MALEDQIKEIYKLGLEKGSAMETESYDELPLNRMQLKLSKKLSVIVLFMTGSIGIIGACLRLEAYVQNDISCELILVATRRSNATSTPYFDCQRQRHIP